MGKWTQPQYNEMEAWVNYVTSNATHEYGERTS